MGGGGWNYAYTVDSHYLQILYLQTHWNLFIPPKSLLSCAFTVIRGHAQSSKKIYVPWCTRSQQKLNKAFLFQHSYCQQVCFMVYLVLWFSKFCSFYWCFCYLQWPPSVVLKCYLVFYVQEVCGVLGRRRYMLNKLHLGVSCSVVGCELRVNESKMWYI